MEFFARCFACLCILVCVAFNLVYGQSPAVVERSQGTRPRTRSPRVRSGPSDDPLKGRSLVCLFNNNDFYRSSNFTPGMIDAELCTHVNYEFASLDPNTYEMVVGQPDLDIYSGFYEEVVGLKEKNPKLKVLLSIGGWKDSTKKYSELVESEDKRNNFVEKAVTFIKGHGFDGLDFAWEYPNCWQGALGVSPKDKWNFPVLLQKLREAMDRENMILSVSVGSIKREIVAAYDVPAISKAVHHINVMTYDMHGPWESTTGHHAQYTQKDGDADPDLNMKSAMELWASLGADPLKLNAGVASYAKTFTLVNPNENGVGARVKGPGKPGPYSKSGGFMCYNELCQMLNAGNWTESEDKPHGFYAWSGDQWASYDPPLMGVRKAKWVMENGFGGVMVKDCGCDDYWGHCFSMPYPFIKMIRFEMIKKAKALR